jgi:hypothetical protein
VELNELGHDGYKRRGHRCCLRGGGALLRETRRHQRVVHGVDEAVA